MKSTFTTLAFLLAFAFSAIGQQTASLKPYLLANGNAKILGTSSIQDWQCATTELSGDARMLTFGDELISLREVRIKIPVASLKSEHPVMDKNTHASLRAETNPNITFVMTEVLSMQFTDGQYTLMTRGRLSVAGATRIIDLPVQGFRQGGKRLVFQGSYRLDMIDYGIKPPAIAFGVIRTDEVVTIEFHAAFEQVEAPQAMN